MLKRLRLWSIAVALLFPVGPYKACAQQQHKSDQGPVSTVTTAPNLKSQNDQNGTHEETPKSHAGIEWSNWALVVIGAVTGLAVWRTLWAIKRQADVMETQANEMSLQHGEMEKQVQIMSDQTGILRNSVAAAQKSADAAFAQVEMIKNKERGRLRIEFDNVNLFHDPDEYEYKVTFKVSLDGSTQVFIIKQSCFAGISESGQGTMDYQSWRTMGVPKTMTPEGRVFRGTMILLTGKIPWAEPYIAADEKRVSLVREEKLYVFVRAVIAYDDLFGGKWEARFNGKWRYYWDVYANGPNLTAGYWESAGYNGEFQRSEDDQNPN